MHLSRIARPLRALVLAALVASALVVLPASPAAAGTLNVSVTRTGIVLGTVSDDQGQINCGSFCSASYPEECTLDPEIHVWFCSGVEASLGATVPSGFQVSWTGCDYEASGRCHLSYAGMSPTSVRSASVVANFADVTNPVISSLSAVPADYASDTVQVSANASDNDQVAHVEYVLTGPGGMVSTRAYFPPYTAQMSVGTLADGTYQLSARAMDRSSRLSDTVMRSIVVDNTAPELPVDGPGVGFTAAEPEFVSSPNPTWSYLASDTGSGIADLRCVVDGEPVGCEPTETSLSLTGLGEGAHSGHFEATDLAGNQTVAGEWNIVVDSMVPATSITSGPKRPVSLSRNATFQVSAEDATELLHACSLDSDEFTLCDDPPSYTGLAAGSHRFQFNAVDAAGNQDPEPATWTWTVPHDDRALTASSGWKNLSASRYYLGTARTTKAGKATLSRGSVRARELYLVASTVPGGGTVDVFHGSKRLKRLKLASATIRHRRIFKLVEYAGLSSAKKLRIVVVTARKPVTIDGVAIVSK